MNKDLKKQSFLSSIVDMGDGSLSCPVNPPPFLWTTVLALLLKALIVHMVDQEVLLDDFLAHRILRTE